jgi:alkyl sulfatase BDS1-like metallo-beta-lactamase superfamily hydrolase
VTKKYQQPALASLVTAGEQQTEAEKITDSIYMTKDISNVYLVKCKEGQVLINAGFMGSAERNQKLLAPLRDGPLHAIFLTQAHADHFGGVPVLKEPDTKIVAQERFVETEKFFEVLKPYLGQRSGKLWGGTIKRRGDPVPEIVPDITFEKRIELTYGGRRFEAIATPGGEAPDAMVVWLPEDKTVFTGNLFGPVFMSVPNFNTVRGDKPRSVNRFLSSLDTVRQLGAELLITGHGEPIRGKDKIQADLDKLYNAVSYLRDQTIDGMNAGKDVHTLMREIQLPEHLQLGEFHGKVNWAVKSIWHEFSGWFMYDSTTSLYDVPRDSVHGDLCELAGGAHALSTRAAQKLKNGAPLEALHLLDVALDSEPDYRPGLETKKAALEALLEASGGQNLSEVMWLKSEITAVETALDS